jgi:glycosyltransferase involved in cell wall biosynthesis
MKADSRVLVVVPAKDEEQSIGRVLQTIRAEYPSFDCLVADDGSTDRTLDIAREKGALVVSHGRNLGVAAAIQTGRIYALEHGYDFIAFCDADGQHNPLDIGRIVTPLLNEKADFVIGSRELGDYIGHEPLRLKLPRYFCSWVISLLTRKRITDPTSGFRGCGRWLVEHFKTVYETSDRLHLSTTNDMEEILIARKKGARITEVPARMLAKETGASQVYTTKTIFHFLTIFPANLIRTVWRNVW